MTASREATLALPRVPSRTMSPPGDKTSRPRRIEELVGQVVRQLRRLDRAITELDQGDEDALDDIVIAIRSLACGGKGNHTITQLAWELEEVPDLHPVTAPADNDEAITFGTGALPVADTHAAGASNQIPRSLEALMNLRCLTVTAPEDNEQRAYSWDQIVSTVANKLGAIHSDQEVPVAVDEIRRFESAGQGTLVHVLRNLAVVVARHGYDVLSASGVEHPLLTPTHRIPANGQVWVNAIEVRKNRRHGGSDVTFEFNLDVPHPASGVAPAVYPLASIPTRMEPAPQEKEIGRNEPCPCGSGTKYKHCCGP